MAIYNTCLFFCTTHLSAISPPFLYSSIRKRITLEVISHLSGEINQYINMASSGTLGAPAMADSRDGSLQTRPLPPLRSGNAQKRRLMGGGLGAGERVDESMRRVMFLNCWGLG